MTVKAKRLGEGIDPEKVAIYIRWSTDDQSEGTTLDVQMEGCRHYVLSQGWNVSEDLIFIDDGHSGGTLDRPAMARLRKAVTAGRIDCVVVFKLDRLSRSVVDTVNLVLTEWDDLCHVKSAREPIDTTNHAGKMFFYMLVSYAEWERNVIRERTWGGRLKRAQEGRNPGFNAPYGYAVGSTPGTLQIVPTEAAVVQRIYQMYLEGNGMRAILNVLNQEECRFRGFRTWNGSTLRHILSNRVYMGDLVWGVRMHNPRYGKRAGEKNRLTADQPLAVKQGAFAPIVDRETWERAQSLREGKPGPMRGTSGRAVSSRFLLTGLARCRCGSAIIGRAGTGRSAHTYYICSGKNAKGASHCNCGYINTEKVDQIAITELRRLYGSKDQRERVISVLASDLQCRLEGLLPESQRLQQLVERIQAQDKDLRRQYRDKEITLHEFRAFKVDMDEDLATNTAQRAKVIQQLEEARRALHDHGQWAEVLARVDDWEALTVPQRKHLLRTVCRSLTLFHEPRGQELVFDAEWVRP